MDPLQPLPQFKIISGTFKSLTTANKIEAIGRVAYVPIAKSEFALTRFSFLTTSGTIASLDGCRIKENTSDIKLIMNKQE